MQQLCYFPLNSYLDINNITVENVFSNDYIFSLSTGGNTYNINFDNVNDQFIFLYRDTQIVTPYSNTAYINNLKFIGKGLTTSYGRVSDILLDFCYTRGRSNDLLAFCISNSLFADYNIYYTVCKYMIHQMIQI